MRKKLMRRFIGLFTAVIVVSMYTPVVMINLPVVQAAAIVSKATINYEKVEIAKNQSINLKIIATTSNMDIE